MAYQLETSVIDMVKGIKITKGQDYKRLLLYCMTIMDIMCMQAFEQKSCHYPDTSGRPKDARLFSLRFNGDNILLKALIMSFESLDNGGQVQLTFNANL